MHQMKRNNSKLKILIFVVVGSLFYGCISERDYIIESDYSYDGNFSKYRTFKFITSTILDTTQNHAQVERTLLRRLNAQGYRVADKKPDLFVLYKIFHDDFEFSGFHQPSFESWVGKHPIIDNGKNGSQTNIDSDVEDEDSKNRLRPSDEVYDKMTYAMNKGTLMVSLYDRKKRKTIWQGYASGVFNRTDHRSAQSINKAAAKIFDEFRLLADGYILNK